MILWQNHLKMPTLQKYTKLLSYNVLPSIIPKQTAVYSFRWSPWVCSQRPSRRTRFVWCHDVQLSSDFCTSRQRIPRNPQSPETLQFPATTCNNAPKIARRSKGDLQHNPRSNPQRDIPQRDILHQDIPQRDSRRAPPARPLPAPHSHQQILHPPNLTSTAPPCNTPPHHLSTKPRPLTPST